MSDPSDPVARIDALTRNARSTWFALLGVLVFVGITLMGVEHIDFYGVDRATKLPLVDVEVPTRYFFIAAPILTAAIYGYFHLYLIRLWDALGSAPARVNGQPIGDVISPWLVTDAALHLRHWLRKDYCTTPRTMESPAMLLNFLLAWAAGIMVLGFLWWQSMPARSFWMTGIAGAALLVSLFSGTASLAMAILRMKASGNGKHANIWSTIPAMSSLLVLVPAVIVFSYQRTNGSMEHLAPLNLIGEYIVEKPADWLSREYAEKEFRAHWCKREQIETCADFTDPDKKYADEWQTRRQNTITALRKPGFNTISLTQAQDAVDAAWEKVRQASTSMSIHSDDVQRIAQQVYEQLSQSAPNLQKADMRNAFLSGINLTTARLQDANLSKAQMEGATLFGAQLQGAELWKAQLQKADLRQAQLQRADLSEAQLQGAYLWGAQLQEAYLWGAQLQGAYLSDAQLQEANLIKAQLQKADLSEAQLQEADLSEAQLQGADLSFSLLTGTQEKTNDLDNTNLSASINYGSALRYVDLRNSLFDDNTDFRNAFLDESVHYTEKFARQMGWPRSKPCQWWPESIESDEKFYGRWRGWVEDESNPYLGFPDWQNIAPPEWHSVTAIAPPTGCEWKTGPMPQSDMAP